MNVRQILDKHNLRARKGLGQNFLVDDRAAERIVAAAEIKSGETVLEIGPGLGALTFPLVYTGARIVAVELDRALAAVLKERLGKKYRDQVEVVVADALQVDLAAFPDGLVVVGNLPYHLASGLIFKFQAAGPKVDRAVLTLQKELAERIGSPPGSKVYGQISVLLQAGVRVETVLTLPPGAFYPPPKVASRTLRLFFNQPPPRPIEDQESFVKVVKAAFGQRRKTLRQALLNAPLGLTWDALAPALEAAGISPTARAESLSVAEFIGLASEISRIGRAGPEARP